MAGNHRQQLSENSGKSVPAQSSKVRLCTTCAHLSHGNATLALQRANVAPRSLRTGDILQLQRTMGNQAVAQMFGDIVQRQSPEEDEPLQGKFTTSPPAQLKDGSKQPTNKTGMPNQLKAGLENLSGMDMSDVRVHYNSPRPVQLSALAYTQGTDIHVAPGQEQHLPHEGWHAVQQKQGRVQPTIQMAGTSVNDDSGLEKEADVMGSKAVQMKNSVSQEYRPNNFVSSTASGKNRRENRQGVLQRVAANKSKTLSWSSVGDENWTGNPSNPSNVANKLKSLEGKSVTVGNVPNEFVSGHMIAAAMGGINQIGNIVGWDKDEHEEKQTTFEQKVYKGGSGIVVPEANERGEVSITCDLTDDYPTIRDAWANKLGDHVHNNFQALKLKSNLARHPKNTSAEVIPAQQAIRDSVKNTLKGGHPLTRVERVPTAYKIEYAPTNIGHSNPSSRTFELTQASLPTVAFNNAESVADLFDAAKGSSNSMKFGQWYLTSTDET